MNSTKSDLSVDYNDEEQYFDDGINPFDSEVLLLLTHFSSATFEYFPYVSGIFEYPTQEYCASL